ncbi:hypothetical protein M9H77_29565 [Catharanthus roseus]|uniref:Uncharacterized protein n=1 Tax=Catharanthus roseus TaxID=4058 RepID=A0ACB9ZUT8_CATRO|nr:hypothetical protein M9H77_29565 [Catharanthus roseus]
MASLLLLLPSAGVFSKTLFLGLCFLISPFITYFFFADDSIIFYKASIEHTTPNSQSFERFCRHLSSFGLLEINFAITAPMPFSEEFLRANRDSPLIVSMMISSRVCKPPSPGTLTGLFWNIFRERDLIAEDYEEDIYLMDFTKVIVEDQVNSSTLVDRKLKWTL